MNKKIIIFFFISSIAVLFCQAQNWMPLNGGIDSQIRALYSDSIDNFLYISGRFKTADADTVAGIAKWDGNQFFPMGCGFDWDCQSLLGGFPGTILTITRYQGEIYAGGYFSKADNKPIKNIAKWNGNTWDSVGTTFNNEGVIGTLKVINDELYAVGFINALGGLPVCRVAKWDGIEWKNIDNFFCNFSSVSAIEFYKGELYVGGNFEVDSGRNDICKWNGQNWVSVGGGFSGTDSWIGKFYVWRDTLFVGGYFHKYNGDPGNNIAAWDDNTWSDLGGGAEPSNVWEIISYENSLFVGGQIYSAGGIPADFIAKWNGEQWCSLGSDFDNAISAFAIFNNELYGGGGFWTIDGDSVNYIAKWTGGNYVDTCGAITNINPETQNLPVGINVFPNPSDGKFIIENLPVFSGKVNLTVYNALGEKVFEKTLFSNHKQITLPVLSDGLYFIKINSRKNTFYDKILIQR